MSLLAQNGICSTKPAAHQLQKYPENNIPFALDTSSLLPIIDVMKGRICYARFLSHRGLEKLTNFIEVKASFLRPVTLTLSQQYRPSKKAVAGSIQCVPYIGFLHKPLSLVLYTGHCYFLCKSYWSVWPVPVFGLPSPGPTASRPLVFSKPYIFYGADGSGYIAQSPIFVAEPSALRRYRDISQ